MRWRGLLIGLAASASTYPLAAADKLQFGPPPTWVKPVPIPDIASASTDSGFFTVLLADQQLNIEPGRTKLYNLIALRIDAPQGLAAGNISLPWNPDADMVTVHRLLIHRGMTQIDVLKGQTFSILRRETNLEAAMLDGMLTANIQPEGLQVGDVVELAVTTEHRDPVMKSHVEAIVGDFNGPNLNQGHVRVQWTDNVPLKAKATTGLPAIRATKAGNQREIEFSVSKLQPLVAPKGAPPRFSIGRLLELSDFGSWSDLALLMLPHYEAASVIPASGQLRDEVEKIRRSSTSDIERAEAALSLVQDKIRYVALFMGQGGYVPASAAETWARRFGDCKAKTALLVGILRELKIDAVPVLANTNGGDGFDSRLPTAFLFNHVLVLARIGGKDYWLDGTRNGDDRLQNISVPSFRWGLPLARDAKLIPIMPPVADQPTVETAVRIDAREGVSLPALARVDMIFRGSGAVDFHGLLSAAPPIQRDEGIRALLKRKVDEIDISSSGSTFDESKGELRLYIEGKAKIDWNEDYYYSQISQVGYDPDFKRSAGQFADAPFATNYPEYSKQTETILLPPGFSTKSEPIEDVNVTIAGVEYRRKATFADNKFTVEATERATVPEVAYQTALADESRLKELSDNSLSIRIPNSYRPTAKELSFLASEKLTTASALISRGNKLLNAGKIDESIVDFTSALAIEPSNALALANRGISYAWKKEYDKAKRDLEAAEKSDPKQAIIFRAKGVMAQQEGEWKNAISAFTTAFQLDPNNDFSLGHRAEVYYASGQEELALADAEAALRLNPRWTNLRLLRANIYLSQAKSDLAAKEADSVRKVSSDSSYDLVMAANIYAKSGRQREAEDAYQQALAIKPEPFIYLNRALNRPLSDSAGRDADLDKALQLDPFDADVLVAEANETRRAGDLKGALSFYDRAIKTGLADSQVRTEAAVLAYKLGKEHEAKATLLQIRKEAAAAPQLNTLCWAKATAGILLESALEDCREALKLSPDNGAYLDSLGMVLLQLGRNGEAVAAYDRAIAKDVGAMSLLGRAIAYARQGENAKASADRAEALRKDPEIETRFKTFGLDFPS